MAYFWPFLALFWDKKCSKSSPFENRKNFQKSCNFARFFSDLGVSWGRLIGDFSQISGFETFFKVILISFLGIKPGLAGLTSEPCFARPGTAPAALLFSSFWGTQTGPRAKSRICIIRDFADPRTRAKIADPCRNFRRAHWNARRKFLHGSAILAISVPHLQNYMWSPVFLPRRPHCNEIWYTFTKLHDIPLYFPRFTWCKLLCPKWYPHSQSYMLNCKVT